MILENPTKVFWKISVHCNADLQNLAYYIETVLKSYLLKSPFMSSEMSFRKQKSIRKLYIKSHIDISL